MAFPTTFLSMQDAILTRLRLTDNTAGRDRVKDWINQHNADLVNETEFLQGDATATLTADEPNFILDTDILRIKQIVIKQESQNDYGPPLIETSIGDILSRRQSGQVAASNNATSSHYALVGHNQLELWPTPATADTAAFWFVKAATALSANGDLFVFPEPYPKAVEFAAAYDAAIWQRDFDLAAIIKPERDMWLAKIRRHLNRRAGGFPHQFRVVGMHTVPTYANDRDFGG